MDLRFWRRNEKISESPIKKAKREISKTFVKAAGLIAKEGAFRGEDFSYPEYDLEEIKIASQADSYIKQSLTKYSYLIYKAGYAIKSENEKASNYIKQRFRMMSFSTSKPVDVLFQEVSDDVVKYSNAFLIKSRVDRIGGSVNATPFVTNKVVGGYFRIDPSTVRIKRDENGKILKYQQVVNGKEKDYLPRDVVHFYMDKDPNHAFGTPRIVAALEDVKLLRKIEGNVISLIYRFAIPIYQWVIGLPENGMQATDREIEEAREEIERVAMDGMLVTNERTKVNAIGASGHALDATNYLKYFEERAFSALGVSASQMGRGGSKQDADSMEAQAHDTVKFIQRVMSIFIENYIINELLLEGGFDPILNEKDLVQYVFEEISLDTKVKLENHEILKFQSNVSTLEETRRNLGKKESVDEERLYANAIDKKVAIDQINEKTKASIKISQSKGSENATGVAGNGKEAKPKSAYTDVESRNRPENQHGKISVKIKESEGDAPGLIGKAHKSKEDNKKTFQAVYNKYEDLRNDIMKRKKDTDIDALFDLASDSMLQAIRRYLEDAKQDGASQALKDMKKAGARVSTSTVDVTGTEVEQLAKATVKKLLKDVRKSIAKEEDAGTVIDAHKYRIRYMMEYLVPKMFWLSYAKHMNSYGVAKIYVDFGDSDDSNGRSDTILTNDFGLSDIPAYHAFCDCRLSLKKAGEK